MIDTETTCQFCAMPAEYTVTIDSIFKNGECVCCDEHILDAQAELAFANGTSYNGNDEDYDNAMEEYTFIVREIGE